MISGAPEEHVARSTPRRRTLGVFALAVALAAGSRPVPALAADAFDLDTLFTLLGRPQSLRATFHERKFVRQLDAPVDSSGELAFDAPATLELRRLQPRAETMRLEGSTLTLQRGRQQRSFQLDEHPEIATYVEAVRAVLAGDRGALERRYDAALSGGPRDWTLRLTPKPVPGRNEPVAAIVLQGRGGVVRTVEVRLVDGDYSVLDIEPLAPR